MPDASLSRFIGLAGLLAKLGNARRQFEPKRLAKHRTARGGVHRPADFACGLAFAPADFELIEALVGPPDFGHRHSRAAARNYADHLELQADTSP